MPAREWVAVYYDNPEEVPAENAERQRSPWMRIMSFPPTAKGDPGGDCRRDYACARARGGGLRLRHPVDAVFRQPAAEHGVSHRPQPCFEVYLNDGNHDGYWDIDMYVP